MFHPTWVDIWTFVGSFGLFLSLFLLFIRFLPAIAIAEVKGVTPMADPHSGHGGSYGYAAGAQPEPTHLLTPEQGGPAAPASGLRTRAAQGDAVPATGTHPAEPIRPDAASQGKQ